MCLRYDPASEPLPISLSSPDSRIGRDQVVIRPWWGVDWGVAEHPNVDSAWCNTPVWNTPVWIGVFRWSHILLIQRTGFCLVKQVPATPPVQRAFVSILI